MTSERHTVKPSPSLASFQTNCPNLVPFEYTTNSGNILFNCGALNGSSEGQYKPAFTVLNTTSVVLTWNNTSGIYQALYLVPDSGNETSCTPSGSSSGLRLLNNTAITLTEGQSWSYCLAFSKNPGQGVTTVSIMWASASGKGKLKTDLNPITKMV
jgi:hypothetical protein